MANALLVFNRESDTPLPDAQSIRTVSERLQPDAIEYPEPRVHREPGLLTAVFNPCDSLPSHGGSVCLGALGEIAPEWHKVGTDAPNGSYGLLRVSSDAIELITDALASRCIWYYQDDSRFIASSCQRAIVMLLGNFEPDTSNYPWMLSTGGLNFMRSLDRRIKRLPLNTTLSVSRERWEANIDSRPWTISPDDASPGELQEKFAQAVKHSVQGMQIDIDNWLLPLSGGFDSRVIALSVDRDKTLNTITWGTDRARSVPRGDVQIAEQVSAALGTAHEFFELESASKTDNVAEVLNLFVKLGEGQTDHISGYMDGFQVWRHIHESRYDGVIRGEIPIGAQPFENVGQLARMRSQLMLADYSNLKPIIDAVLRDIPQERDDFLLRLETESIEQYTQRMHTNVVVPMALVPLNVIKSMYCEVLTPLLTHSLMDMCRRLPSQLTQRKAALKQLAKTQLPDIGIASSNALESKVSIANSPMFAKFLLDYLKAHSGAGVLSPHTYQSLIAFIEKKRSRSAARARPRPSFWQRVWRKIMRANRPVINPMHLALRLYIVLESKRVFEEDAQALQGRS
ncbi:MAG: asparagine synthase-related protein [Pseudomonadota bacterium]